VTVAQLAARYEIHPGHIQSWKKALLQESASLSSGKQDKGQKGKATSITRLFQQVSRLTVERDFL